MAVFTIPKYKFEDLEKKIEKIRRKGASVVFDVVDSNVIHTYKSDELNMNIGIPCIDVEVSGQYVVNGWAFVAIIEHSSPENIIRIIDQRFYGRVPERYRTSPKTCEHCHMRRDRNDTYLIYNEDEDDWKQVGRTCLKNYTQGLDAETCASMADVFSEIDRMFDDNGRQAFADVDFHNPLHSDRVGFQQDKIRKQILQYIKDNGYLPVKTVEAFKEKLFARQHLSECTDAEIDQITDAATRLGNSDWSRNAHAAWNKEYIELRDFNLIASLCSICLQNIAKENARRNSGGELDNAYAGEVGDTVEFTITSAMISHYRTPNVYRANPYPVYRMTDETGKIYMWGSTNEDVVVEPGRRIKGRIKATFEKRNGEKITELTRCKVD